jgi:hypothetical protein
MVPPILTAGSSPALIHFRTVCTETLIASAHS